MRLKRPDTFSLAEWLIAVRSYMKINKVGTLFSVREQTKIDLTHLTRSCHLYGSEPNL